MAVHGRRAITITVILHEVCWLCKTRQRKHWGRG